MADEGIGMKDGNIIDFRGEDSGEGMYETEGMLYSSDIAWQHAQETDKISSKGSRCEGSGMELDVDSLAVVFLYLPYKDLFEVMLVGKRWEKTVIEADNLWEKVEVVRKWDLGVEGVGAVGLPLLFRVLGVAKEVKISYAFDHAKEHMMWIGGALGPNLTNLESPMDCKNVPFLLSLQSSFLHLKSLVFIGEPEGDDPLCICYLNREKIEPHNYEYQVCMSNSISRTFECPNLTHLSITSPFDGDHALSYALNCPEIIKLCLSSIYSTPLGLKSMAARSPSIKWLEVECGYESPFNELTHFTNLTRISMT